MTNEKEWWKDDKYFVVTDMNEHGEVTGERPNIEAIITEAERRGYEKAMKEVSEAVIPTAATLTLANEETIDVHYIPKSFVLR